MLNIKKIIFIKTKPNIYLSNFNPNLDNRKQKDDLQKITRKRI
jgi:hypothetical protein